MADLDGADAILTGSVTQVQTERYSNGTGGTRWDASAVVRLVTQDKRILWVSETSNNRFAVSASSSVADHIVKGLLKAVAPPKKQRPDAVQPGPDRSKSPSQTAAALQPVEKTITGAQPDAAADAEFVAQLNAEFPEVVEDSARMDRGLPPQTPLFKRAAEIYRENVALDPALGGSKGALLLACRQAKRELDAEKKAAPQAGSTAPPKVRLTSSPTGAEVSIDGEYFGSTPIAVNQKEGVHIFRVKKGCYLPWERTITLKVGDAQTVLAQLDPEPVDPTKPSIAGLCDAP